MHVVKGKSKYELHPAAFFGVRKTGSSEFLNDFGFGHNKTEFIV